MPTRPLLRMLLPGLLLLASATRASEDAATRPDLSGHWVLNEKKSELPKPGGGGEGGGRSRGGGGWGGRGGGGWQGRGRERSGDAAGRGGALGPGGGRMMLPPDMVVELADSELTVSVRGLAVRRIGFGNVPATPAPGDSVPTVQARWQGARLVSELESRRGGRVEESWELSADGGELVVTTRLPGMGDRPPMDVKHVYDRASD